MFGNPMRVKLLGRWYRVMGLSFTEMVYRRENAGGVDDEEEDGEEADMGLDFGHVRAWTSTIPSGVM
jgi:hypothetical protein